jgi:cytochrome bd-type quinol oxidase subunit 2
MPIVKLIVILMLVAIVVNLGSALFQLARGTGDSKQMLRALTWRIGLSVLLFVLLLLAYSAGFIRPHEYASYSAPQIQ